MNQRERISLISVGVIGGIVMGVIYKDISNCLITGVIVASIITLMLNQKAKKQLDSMNKRKTAPASCELDVLVLPL